MPREVDILRAEIEAWRLRSEDWRRLASDLYRIYTTHSNCMNVAQQRHEIIHRAKKKLGVEDEGN